LRLRSPAKIASILIVACALCLVGVALAAGGSTKKLGPHFSGAAIDQRNVLVQRHRARAEHRAALTRHRHRFAGPPLAKAQPVRRAPRRALAAGVAVGASHAASETVATAAEPQSPQAPPQVTASNPSSPPVPPGAPIGMPTPTPPVESAAPALYWGASIGSQLTGVQAPWDMGAVTRFEQIAGKQVSLVNFFAPFANCASTPCSFYPFPTGPMERIHDYGAIPVFSWSSQSIPSNRAEPDFQLSDAIAGRYDSYVREFAEDARDWGHPFFLRFNWEMNGTWFPWSEGVNGNQPGEFVAAWRHVHDIFAAVGADNVTWVWCPNVDPDAIFHDLGSLYPGDAYVDWTGLDGYNWGLNPAKPDRWRSFNELFSTTYTRVAELVAPSKPMLIGEIGSTELGGSKANWIEEALAAIPSSYPKIRGLLWFDTYDDGMDWPIETSASSAGAFAQGIQSPAYVDEGEPATSEGAISPPS
jgi:hypothetical protein